ncbi:MAG TPA: pyridoxamine 5'-phosphate oxidase family protein [Solirubrobacteraceae bacterium]
MSNPRPPHSASGGTNRPGGDAPPAGTPPESAPQLVELTRQECIELLRGTGLGRIVVYRRPPGLSEEPLPLIRPVNYVFDDVSQSIVFQSLSGSKLHELTRSRQAAFEVDGQDAAGRSGWSVIIHGHAEPITQANEVRRLDGLGLRSLAAGLSLQWVRLKARTITGRRIGWPE